MMVMTLQSGEGEYGCKTLLMQAGDYQQTALCHPRQFVPPTVIFLFTGPVVGAVSTALSAVNVNCETVENVRNRTSKLFHSSHIPCSSQLYCNQGLILTDTQWTDLTDSRPDRFLLLIGFVLVLG